MVFDCDDTIMNDIGQLAYNYILDNTDLFKIDFDDI